MSVCYDVKEYLEVQEITEENREILEFAKEHLAWLGWKMLTNSAKVNKISLLCGEKKLFFCGDTVDANFHDMIRTLEENLSFQLTMEYYHCWRGSDPEFIYDHLSISSYLEKTNEVGSQHIFYSMYNRADCGEGAGVLCAYGEKKGHTYSGIIQDKPIFDFPDTGNWYAPNSVLVYEPENLDHLDVKVIANIIKELRTLSEDDDIIVSENELSYFMNNFQPKNAKDFIKFTDLASKLIELTDGECYVAAELVDLDDPYGRILKINMENNEKYSITMASVE